MLAYLGRYTHRVAIANSRLISLSDGKVRFTWKDYRQDGKTKMMTLEADEFIRRFLLHTLPDGFHRIRHYGFLANGGRRDHLGLCRRAVLRFDNASAWSTPPMPFKALLFAAITWPFVPTGDGITPCVTRSAISILESGADVRIISVLLGANSNLPSMHWRCYTRVATKHDRNMAEPT